MDGPDDLSPTGEDTPTGEDAATADAEAVDFLRRWNPYDDPRTQVPEVLQRIAAMQVRMAVTRAARWAVAQSHEVVYAHDPCIARLDELEGEERRRLLTDTLNRATLAYRGIAHLLEEDPTATEPSALPEAAGMLAWTRGVLDHLEDYLARCEDAPTHARATLGARFAEDRRLEAEAWREGTPLAFWHARHGELDRGPAWLNLIALAVWVLEVEPKVRRARRAVGVRMGTLAGFARIGTVEVLAPREAPRGLQTRGDAWVPTAALDAAALTRIHRGIALLDTPTAPRMVAFLAHRIQRRLDPREPLEWRGTGGRNAWEALAAELEIEDAKRVREVRDVVETLGHLHYRTPTGREVGGLWTTYYDPGGGRGKVGRLTVTPNAGISGTVDDTDTGDDRFLVPLPALPGWCAPMIGRRNEYGAYARLWLWTLCRLREDAEDLTRQTGVLIDGATWAAAAVEVGLQIPEPLLVAQRLVDRWTQDGDDGRAVLERVAPNRYHLAPHLAAERAMLEEAGRRTIQGRKGGKAAAEQRAHPGTRRGRKPRGG
jgi:hypothetical protein